MKYIKYLLILVVTAVAMVSCDVDSEDTFSKEATAPELAVHGDILMTENTPSENVTFAWTPARFIGENLTYKLMASYEDEDAYIGSVTTTSYSVSKSDFQAKLYEVFPNLPENDSFLMSFYVTVNGNDSLVYKSKVLNLTIYASGDSIPAIVTPGTDIVLSADNATEDSKILSWTPARLSYGEIFNYQVYIVKSDSVNMTLIGDDIEGTSFSMQNGKLNDAIIAAGFKEGGDVQGVSFVVKTKSDNNDAVASEKVTMNVTTFKLVFSDYIYLPGGYQSWTPSTAPKIALSSIQKGYYESMIDFGTAGSGDVEFKFTEQPEWPGDEAHPEYKDFTFDPITVSTFAGDANQVTSSTLGANNVKMPAGFYDVIVDKKNAILTMIEIKTLGIIGDAVGSWDSDQAQLTYDSVTNKWTGTATFTGSGSFKIRCNEDWTYSYGSDGQGNLIMNGGSNINGPTQAGDYIITIDVSINPYTVTVTK